MPSIIFPCTQSCGIEVPALVMNVEGTFTIELGEVNTEARVTDHAPAIRVIQTDSKVEVVKSP